MFASRTLVEHLARGALGVACLTAAVSIAATHPWSSLALIAVGLVALRGCPMCWTLGLAQTLAARLRGVTAADACIDGSCKARRP